MNRHFSKENMHMANKHKKKLYISCHEGNVKEKLD